MPSRFDSLSQRSKKYPSSSSVLPYHVQNDQIDTEVAGLADDTKRAARSTWQASRRYQLLVAVLVFGSVVWLAKLFIFRASFGTRRAAPDMTFHNGTHYFGPTVILISIDGFRSDYLQRGVTPNMLQFASQGVRAEYMTPSFPSITFPNHWTLVTGLYPEAHGIVGNEFYDPKLKEAFIHKKVEISNHPKWWGGEPIWKTASNQGKRSAVVMWPGSGVSSMRPDDLMDYDREVMPVAKMDQVLSWLDRPLAERPQMISVYVPQVDQKGHGGGPDGPQLNTVLRSIDDAIGHLIAGLEERNLEGFVHTVIVSDHGMAATDKQRAIYYEEILSAQSLAHMMDREAWPLLNLRPKPDAPASALQQMYDELDTYARLNPDTAHYRVFRREDVPEHYHYSNNERIAPIVMVPDVGYTIVQRDKHFPRGVHGYDHLSEEMRAIFLARGPRIERAWGRGAILQPFQNVEVYHFVADLLHLDPAPTNCTLCSHFVSKQEQIA
ncbi:alkaline-phosphatase-like protein [Gongronella butleri]|nr:alkaline-phosphatase-like protein [Gongronella butleri]